MSTFIRGDFYTDRGLGSGLPEEAAPVPTPVESALPLDYEARYAALEFAIRWTAMALHSTRTEQTLQRALDFHAFLIARQTPPE